MPSYKLLLTASGTGSRLGELTKDTNKALVPVNGRATVSYVLDSYAKDIPVVVTLGYLGDQVKDFLLSEYPDRKFEFVTVDPFIGEGSSLLYSMRSAKALLQCPFIFHACDTIVLEAVPPPTEDWVAGYLTEPSAIDIAQYGSHTVVDGYITEIQSKGAARFDSIHIGMTGIHSYESFWDAVEEVYLNDPADQSLGDVPVVERMSAQGTKFKWIPFRTWLDTGNIPALQEAERLLRALV
ncbi:MAG: hypothetical protein V4681_03875 [Patescibacteria group bacterium]